MNSKHHIHQGSEIESIQSRLSWLEMKGEENVNLKRRVESLEQQIASAAQANVNLSQEVFNNFIPFKYLDERYNQAHVYSFCLKCIKTIYSIQGRISSIQKIEDRLNILESNNNRNKIQEDPKYNNNFNNTNQILSQVNGNKYESSSQEEDIIKNINSLFKLVGKNLQSQKELFSELSTIKKSLVDHNLLDYNSLLPEASQRIHTFPSENFGEQHLKNSFENTINNWSNKANYQDNNNTNNNSNTKSNKSNITFFNNNKNDIISNNNNQDNNSNTLNNSVHLMVNLGNKNSRKTEEVNKKQKDKSQPLLQNVKQRSDLNVKENKGMSKVNEFNEYDPLMKEIEKYRGVNKDSFEQSYCKQEEDGDFKQEEFDILHFKKSKNGSIDYSIQYNEKGSNNSSFVRNTSLKKPPSKSGSLDNQNQTLLKSKKKKEFESTKRRIDQEINRRIKEEKQKREQVIEKSKERSAKREQQIEQFQNTPLGTEKSREREILSRLVLERRIKEQKIQLFQGIANQTQILEQPKKKRSLINQTYD